MALFLDSADLDEIRPAMELGLYAGVTTNPNLLRNIPPKRRLEHLEAIARICRGSLYIQVDLAAADAMERQALALRELAKGRVVIKVPHSPAGLRLTALLQRHSLPVCLTAAFTPLQAYAAGLAGAHAVALYVGRIARRGGDGLAAVAQSAAILRAGGHATRVLAASIPDAASLEQLLLVPGIDVTIGARLEPALLEHAGTAAAIADFAGASGGIEGGVSGD